MVEPTRRQVDRTLEESMDLFERAKVGKVAAVEPRRPERILLVADGSSQDRPARAITRCLSERFKTSVAVLDARETDAPSDLAARMADSLSASVLEKLVGSSFEQILEAIASTQSDLAVVPCPYQRDLKSVGPDSAGTVIDVLIARSPAALLVVRRPFEPQGDLFTRVRLLMTGENDAAQPAAAWSVGLVVPGGGLRLVLILEVEFYENLKAVLPSIAPGVEIDPDALSGALAKTQMRLHRGLQKAASEGGFAYELAIQRQDESSQVVPDNPSAHPLLVLPLERSDDASRGFVQRVIRLSPHPLLVVPVD